MPGETKAEKASGEAQGRGVGLGLHADRLRIAADEVRDVGGLEHVLAAAFNLFQRSHVFFSFAVFALPESCYALPSGAS